MTSHIRIVATDRGGPRFDTRDYNWQDGMEYMLKKILFVSGWMGATVFTLFFCLMLTVKMAGQKQNLSMLRPQVAGWADNRLVFSAIPPVENRITTAVRSADARSEIIRQYLSKFGSPLEPHSDLLVRVADENGFDFRWMVAIAQQESNLCKRIPVNSFNCWGWGIYGDKVTRFESYEQAITKIAPQFKDKFLVHGSKTEPSKVMQTYTPPSDGSWAYGVNQFMDDMQ